MRKPDYLGPGELAVAVRTRTVTEQPSVGKSVLEANAAWMGLIRSASTRNLSIATWISECALSAHQALEQTVEVDAKRRGGVPVIKGTRFTVAQALAELADSDGVEQVATRCTLDVDMIRNLLLGLSMLAEQPHK